MGKAKKSLKRVGLASYRFVPFKEQFATAIRPVPLPWSVKRHLRFDGVVAVRIDAQHSFRVLTGGPIENNLFWNGYGHGWEATSLQLWAELAPTCRTILDVGANVGIYSLAARATNPNARVIAFEPVERTYERLEANARLNGFDIETYMVAVSDRDGTATLFDADQSYFCAASLEESAAGHPRRVAREVPTVRLDTHCQNAGIKSIDLLKLDIEGHEPAAVAGMGELLERCRPTLLVEVLGDAAAHALTNQLRPLGYELYRIHEGRGIRRADAFAAHESHDRNYLVAAPGTLERTDLARHLLLG